jgi:hypothetical protein
MDISEIIRLLKANSGQYGITLYQSASELEILKFEDEVKIKLPHDIKKFYEFCNGFESAEDLFRIIPLYEITDRLETYKPNSFYFAEYLTYCDMWELSINPDEPNDYQILNNSRRLRPMTKSFTEFLERFLAKGVFGRGGLYDWQEEIESSGS